MGECENALLQPCAAFLGPGNQKALCVQFNFDDVKFESAGENYG
jgi:hypothetical protein